MKGIYIFEEPFLKDAIACLKLSNIEHKFKCEFGESITEDVYLHALVENSVSKSRCNKDDTYDFETGALIALMKMCGVDKVVRACNEAFSEDTFKTYATKYERELNELKKDSDKVIDKLIEENEKLKLDCEKLQHGYNDMIFCGGRQNGKQYTALVNMFKKLDQKKVDAAYKEAYDKWIAQPIWQKEVFKQIHKDQLASLLEAGKYLYEIPTKREEMWDDILKEGRTPVYVKREDIHEFLKECQATGIKWTTGKMPLETMPFHMSKGYDGIYFFVMTSLDISKSTPEAKEFRHVMCWWMTASDEEARNSIKYIPPMRWDLFKKGRLAVKVTPDNYKEFYEACEKFVGKKPMTVYTGDYTVSICKKDGLFEVFTMEHQKSTGRKIVNWEDVR